MIHLILQGKGGVGKTYVSVLVAQYLKSKYENIVTIDTDSVNPTFTQYNSLNVDRLALMEENKINERGFDVLMERFLTEEVDAFVVDNGASSFVPFSNYLVENEVIDLLKVNEKDVMVHTVLGGGQGLDDTLQGFETLTKYFDNIFVWKNEYFGELKYNGKPFEETTTYKNNEDKIFGTATIGFRSPDTFGKDVELMLKNKLTFDDVMANSEIFNTMSKQRINIIKKDIFSQLSNYF
jgi:hypothetical protein